jgi:hypothetical protein
MLYFRALGVVSKPLNHLVGQTATNVYIYDDKGYMDVC